MTLSPRDALRALLDDVEVQPVDDDAPATPRLAVLWQGELDRDLSESVIKQLRFDQFVREVVQLGADVAIRMVEAALEYTVREGSRDDAEDREE
jgi:hypothetical protein